MVSPNSGVAAHVRVATGGEGAFRHWPPLPSRSAVALAAMLVLAGCGGGGGGGSAPANQPPTARFTATPDGGPAPLQVSFDASGSSDADGTIASYEWDIGGVSASGRTVDHTFDQKGAVTVRLTVTDDDSATASASQELLVNANPVARIVADPPGGVAPLTVSFDGQLSSDADGTVERHAWDFGGETASGATATWTFSSPGLYAPRLTVTDDLGGTGEVVFELNVRDPARDEIDFAVPWAANGAYAEALRPCLYDYDLDGDDFCALAQLPFLGAEFDAPTVDDVMSRVLVSHRWMGDSLRALLELMPADVLLLARSITGIVIATDVRPSHYRPDTGAIYMDADYFWRTAEQLAVVSREPDFRVAFQRKLQLDLPWRLVRNNQRFGIRRDENGVRVQEDAAIWLSFVLFHEFSHAADFMHYSRIAGLDASWTPWEAMLGGQEEGWRQWPSFRLATSHPLRSDLLYGLAEVSFLGEDPTPQQAALQAEDIVDEFAGDGAADFYSYSSLFEDMPQLHSYVLMSYHFGQEPDTGITDNPPEPPYTVAWGQRGRITDPLVIDRARFALEEMYPGDVQQLVSYVSSRPAPLQMRPGDSWRDNVVLEGGGNFSSKAPPTAGFGADAPWPERHGGAVGHPQHGGGASAAYLGCLRLGAASSETLRELGALNARARESREEARQAP